MPVTWSSACTAAVAARAVVAWRRTAQSLRTPPCLALPQADFPKVPKGGCVCLRVGGVGRAWPQPLESFGPVLRCPLVLPASISAGSAKRSFLNEASFGKEVGRCTCVLGQPGIPASAYSHWIGLALVCCQFVRGSRRSFFWWLWCGVAQMCRKRLGTAWHGVVLATDACLLHCQARRCVTCSHLYLPCLRGSADACNGVFEVASGFLMYMLH